MKATKQMSQCVNFNHYWKDKGNMTCSIIFKNSKGELEIYYRKCLLIDGNDCPEYQRSEVQNG